MEKLNIKVTWRLIFYLVYIAGVIFLVTRAMVYRYENTLFFMAAWILFIMSYPFSIFLIKKEEER